LLSSPTKDDRTARYLGLAEDTQQSTAGRWHFLHDLALTGWQDDQTTRYLRLAQVSQRSTSGLQRKTRQKSTSSGRRKNGEVT